MCDIPQMHKQSKNAECGETTIFNENITGDEYEYKKNASRGQSTHI